MTTRKTVREHGGAACVARESTDGLRPVGFGVLRGSQAPPGEGWSPSELEAWYRHGETPRGKTVVLTRAIDRPCSVVRTTTLIGYEIVQEPPVGPRRPGERMVVEVRRKDPCAPGTALAVVWVRDLPEVAS